MYIYSLYIGDYFLFLLPASNTNPVRLQFKDHEIQMSGKKSYIPWKEKIYLYPAILQRKWIDYKIKGKFIPHVRFDNVLPCELQHPFLISIADPVEFMIRSYDKEYRQVLIQLINLEGNCGYEEMVPTLTTRASSTLSVKIKQPGIYKVLMSTEDKRYKKSNAAFYRRLHILSPGEELHLQSPIYCTRCGCRIFPVETRKITRYMYVNYIPFKEYVDLNGLRMDYISDYIKKLHHPEKYKRGLIHLLNIIRLASIEDEIEIISSLYKEDSSFAHFITNRLFLFPMMPLMEDRELQRILNSVDDSLIARSLFNVNRLIAAKVLRNISKRRADIVKSEMDRLRGRKETSTAQDEMEKIIKSYFEERFGRVVRIPSSELPVHIVDHSENTFENIKNHSGDLVILQDDKIYLECTGEDEESCVQFDIESCGEDIFSVTGVSEGTIYLKCEIGIRYVLIHVYYWASNLECSEFLENIAKHMIIPFGYASSALVLTIGAISSKGTPHEQVIRLKIK